ncbi:MAG: cytidine deaminase [Lachnospiraceae bacterium]|nr:cytidine deaminase [Lachnospiraceae bacterium]
MDIQKLINEALKARERSYSPYSDYKVGAALLCENGKIYKGCNIENSSYGASNCAERTAVFKAVSEGEVNFKAIAIVGSKADCRKDIMKDYAYPCGICRQVLSEFTDPDSFKVIVARSENEYREYLLKELLPLGFSRDNLS